MKAKAVIAALEHIIAEGHEDISPQTLLSYVLERQPSDMEVFLIGEKRDINELLEETFGEQWDAELEKRVWEISKDYIGSWMSDYYFHIMDNITDNEVLSPETINELKQDFQIRKLVSEGYELDYAKVMVSLQW
jgi:hypothetical protein